MRCQLPVIRPCRASVLATLAAAHVVAGCATAAVMSAIPASTLKRLWAFDVARLDVPRLRVAARLPETLQPREVIVTIEAWRAGAGERRRAELRLEPAAGEAELQPLERYARPGHRLHVYRLSADDARRMEAFRANGTADGGGERAEIAVAVKACRRGPLPKGPLPTTTLLRTDASDYFVLLDDLDMRAVASEAELIADVQPCG